MAQQIINQVGAFLQDIADKINANFTELFARPSGGSPGGSDTQVQFNDADSFGGDQNFTFQADQPDVGGPLAALMLGDQSKFVTTDWGVSGLALGPGATTGNAATNLVLVSLGNRATDIVAVNSGGTLGAPTQSRDSATLTDYFGAGYDTDDHYRIATGVSFSLDGAPQSGYLPGKIALRTSNSDSDLNTVLSVDSSKRTTLFGDLTVSTPTVPAAANSTGVAGSIAWDSGFIYICVATDTWKRVAIATWP